MNSPLVVKQLREKAVDLESQVKNLELKLAAMQQQRDFWTEQSRTYQNQLQIVFGTQASILEQLAKSSVCTEDMHVAIANMAADLRKPQTAVAAIEALAASCRPGTQGRYTALNQDKTQRIGDD
ncbi:hypothetical protein ACFIQF_22635 [Comamonas sp. J-3]|uniref:hypothetical protein n=1 Tax=Comamonas trifloxystrobinivorans TaxID=3350256 RepID=UPI00372CDFB0